MKFNSESDYLNKISVLKSLIVGNIFLYSNIDKINHYLEKLETNLEHTTFTDGGHVTRCPIQQINTLRNLVEIRAAIATINKINSKTLHEKVISYDYFKMFCMPDNRMGFFNGELVKKIRL